MANSKDDWEEVPMDDWEEVSLEEPKPEELGLAEAAGLGLGAGAAFGLEDILSGVGSAGMEVASDVGDLFGGDEFEVKGEKFKAEDDYKGLQGLVEAYRHGKGKSAELHKQAADESPWAYYGGALSGGLSGGAGAAKLAPKLGTLGKALPSLKGAGKGATLGQKMGHAAKEGMKAGALAGFGKGDADLTKGEVGETIKETLGGMSGGAALGAGLQGVGSGIAAGAKALGGAKVFAPIKTGYRWGLQGFDLDEKVVQDETRKLAKEIHKRIGKKLDTLGMKKKEIREFAEKMNVRISMGKEVRSLRDELVEKLKSTYKTKQGGTKVHTALDDAIAVIDDLTGDAELAIKKKVAQKIKDIKSKEFGKFSANRAELEKKAAQSALKKGEQSEIVDSFIEAGEDSSAGVRKGINTRAMDVETTRSKPVKDPYTGEVSMEDVDVVERFTKDITQLDPVATITKKGNEMVARIKDKITGKELAKFRQVINKASNIDDMSFGEAESFLKEINKYSGIESELIDDKQVIGLMKRLAGKVNQKMQSSLDNVKDLGKENKKIRELLLAKKKLGIKDFDPNVDTQEELNRVQKKISGTGTSGMIDKESLFERFKKAGIDRGGKIRKRSEMLDQVRRITGDSSTEEKITRANIVTSSAAGGSNIVGKGARFAGKHSHAAKKWVKNNYQSLLDADENTVKSIAGKFAQKGVAGAKYAQDLNKLATSEGRLKTLILYRLTQQPGFREMLRDIE